MSPHRVRNHNPNLQIKYDSSLKVTSFSSHGMKLNGRTSLFTCHIARSLPVTCPKIEITTSKTQHELAVQEPYRKPIGFFKCPEQGRWPGELVDLQFAAFCVGGLHQTFISIHWHLVLHISHKQFSIGHQIPSLLHLSQKIPTNL